MYATLPKGKANKLSRAVSKDTTRPILAAADLQHTDDGWRLVATDSYQLVFVPLSVNSAVGPELTPGPISAEALKAIEKTGSFYANGTVEPCDEYGERVGTSYARETREQAGQYPNIAQLIPEPDQLGAFTFAFNPELLAKIAAAMGVAGGKGQGVKLTFQVNEGGELSNLRPAIVEPLDGSGQRAVLMPIRH